MSLSFLVALVVLIQDPMPNPADPQKKPGTQEQDKHIPTYEVVGKKVSDLQEEDLIGTYDQPRWTATRRFPTTRVYVVPEGKVEFEWWMRTTFPEDDGPASSRYLWELEFGLPYRLQLDLYLGMEGTGSQGDFNFNRQQIELRWALADWDVIWGNPTLYAEYINKSDESDAAEFKLLFGGEITQSWHWGVNGVYEHELHDSLTNEWQFTGGVSKTLIDSKLSVGAEAQLIWEDTVHTRGHYEETVFVGPSVQWKPQPAMTVNLVAMAGVGPDSPDARTYVNVGWEF